MLNMAISVESRRLRRQTPPPPPPSSGWSGTAFASVLAMSVGLGAAAYFGTVLTWDGAAALLRVLHYAEPFTTHGRVVVSALQLPVLALQRSTENLEALRLAYSVPYVLVPLVALVASWLMIGRRAPRMMVWPALGIALATLPGQLFFISENVIAVQLAWPLLLALLVGLDVKRAIAAGVLLPILFFLHPVSSAIFALAAVVAVGNAVLRRGPRLPMLGLAVGLGVLSFLRTLRLDDFERGELGIPTLVEDFYRAVAGAPLAALLIGFALGVVILLAPRVGAVGRLARRRARILAAAPLIVIAGVLVWWAANPSAWSSALAFRSWALLCSLPFIALAALDQWWPAPVRDDPFNRGSEQRDPATTGLRKGVTVGLAAVFAVVIGVASLSWAALLQSHRQEVAALRAPCVSQGQLSTVAGTPLDHWATGALTVVQQSRAPLRVMLETPVNCEMFLAGGPPTVLGQGRSLRAGWFSFLAARWAPPA